MGAMGLLHVVKYWCLIDWLVLPFHSFISSFRPRSNWRDTKILWLHHSWTFPANMSFFEGICRGWNPTQLCGDYFIKNKFGFLLANQDSMESRSFFCFAWLIKPTEQKPLYCVTLMTYVYFQIPQHKWRFCFWIPQKMFHVILVVTMESWRGGGRSNPTQTTGSIAVSWFP